MKTAWSVLTTVLLSCALIGPAVAQQHAPVDTLPSPRGVEGSEIRKQTPKDAEKLEMPKAGRRGPQARDQRPKDTGAPPIGVEGPEMRKQEPKSKGGVEVPKTDKKKRTRAKSKEPNRTEVPPKIKGKPKIDQEAGGKVQ